MWSELIERRGQSGCPRSGGVASGTGEAKGPFGMKMVLSAGAGSGAGAGIAGNSGASAWSRTRHPPFGEAGAQSLTGSRGKASQSPESDWGCARAAGLQPAGRPSPTSGMG